MYKSLSSSISEASKLEPDLVAKILTRTEDLKHGDFAFPCFILAKAWKMSPPEAAKRLSSEIKLPAGFSKFEVSGPYLNFFIDRTEHTKKYVRTALKADARFGAQPAREETYLVEYSSPNIAKPFHVGHLRTTLIGLSLDRVYRHLGYKVHSINHLGDWGTQFGFVYAGCELWGRPEKPTVDDLVDIYVKATNLKKAQEENQEKEKPDVNQIARDYFKRLEAGEANAVEFWRWCLDLTVGYLKDIYARLGIFFDHYTGESFYSDKIPATEKLIRESGILENSKGALGVDLGKDLGFARIFTEDGRSLYITRDLAAALYRYDTYKPKEILYVVAAQQSLHFQQLVGIFKRMNHPVTDCIKHVSFGFVPGMSTRAGTAISLHLYLKEASERALKAYREEVEKRPEGVNETEVAEKVAVGATYFYFLSHSNIKDFNFSWEQALSFQGDSGPYVQYALARLNSIEAKAKEAGIAADTDFDASLIVDDQAYELTALLGQFEETLQRITKDNEPIYLTQWCLETAKAFSRAYRGLRVIGEEPALAKARLSLFMATRNALRVGLFLIGVPTVERM